MKVKCLRDRREMLNKEVHFLEARRRKLCIGSRLQRVQIDAEEIACCKWKLRNPDSKKSVAWKCFCRHYPIESVTNTQSWQCWHYLYSHIFTISPLFDYYDVSKHEIRFEKDTRELHFKVAYFIGLFHFSWHSQNEVGNIDILVLGGDCEKTLMIRGSEPKWAQRQDGDWMIAEDCK